MISAGDECFTFCLKTIFGSGCKLVLYLSCCLKLKFSSYFTSDGPKDLRFQHLLNTLLQQFLHSSLNFTLKLVYSTATTPKDMCSASLIGFISFIFENRESHLHKNSHILGASTYFFRIESENLSFDSSVAFESCSTTVRFFWEELSPENKILLYLTFHSASILSRNQLTIFSDLGIFRFYVLHYQTLRSYSGFLAFFSKINFCFIQIIYSIVIFMR